MKYLTTATLIATAALLALAAPASGQQIITIPNQGGAMEGHTPRGFRGMGTGIFIGDDLNPNFPAGGGVQAFLTFGPLPSAPVATATLTSDQVKLSGDPIRDLGPVTAEVVSYSRFSPDLWDLAPSGTACTIAAIDTASISCDVTAAVNDAIAGGSASLQLRLRLENAGDGDGTQDMVMFFAANPNQNQPGLLALEVVPAD